MEILKNKSLMTAVKTPYTTNGEIDLNSFDVLVERLIEQGVEGLIVGGTTGEGHLMSWDEHIMLIAHCVHKFGNKLAIVGNTGSNNTKEAIHATRQGFAVGMDAALQINPYYGKTSKDGLLKHFQRVLDIGPGIIYNVPGRTGQDIQPEIMEVVAKNPNFLGVKECMGNERIAYYENKGIACWSGCDDSCFESRHECGGHGVISVTGNLVPGLMRKLMDNKDTALNERLKPLFSWLFCKPNPIPLNTALSMTRSIKPVFRLPYVPLNQEERQKGLEILKSYSQEELVGKEPVLMSDEEFIFV